MQERHVVVAEHEGTRVVAMDSITHANNEFGPFDVLVGASFCGIVAVQFAATYQPKGVIAHDCGRGLDGAGINGLWFLEGRGIPAAAVDSRSARIADGVDTWERGRISVTNRWAALLGVAVGDSVREASAKLCAWDGSAWEDDVPRGFRQVVYQGNLGAVVAVDSIRFALPEDSNNIVCVGSHGGQTAAAYALDIRPRGFISSDGGVGIEDSGVSGLAVLDDAGIPAAAVAVANARIGDGLSIYGDGVISRINSKAAEAGVRVGQSAREAAAAMLGEAVGGAQAVGGTSAVLTLIDQVGVDVRHWIDVFVSTTDARADEVYASSEDADLTYGELRQQVDAVASALLRRGIRPGQVLAVWMTSSLEFLVAQWATYRLGCALLPLYSYYREEELRHALRESRAAVLFTSSRFAGKVDVPRVLTELLPELARRDPVFAEFPDLRLVVESDSLDLPGSVPVAELVADGGVEVEGLETIRARTAPLDIMNVMYTSGTTGIPKAGMSLHANNLATIDHWSQLARLGPDDVILAHVPMFTNFGALYTNGLAMRAGARLEVTRTFDAAESLRRIRECGVTYVPGSPEIFRMLLDHPDFVTTDTGRVHSAHVAGSAVEPELMQRIIDELAPNAMQAYGMSECGGLSTVTSDRDPMHRRLETVGRPLPSAHVRIVDPLTGAQLPPDTVGEVWFGDRTPGSCVGKGYLASPAATAAAITPSGWFRSGDLGRMDADGYLTFTGRLKNMITVGGFNVYPAEIERHLQMYEDVDVAIVVGLPDERLGSVPVAFVVLRTGSGADVDAEALITYMRSRVSSQKQPRFVWFVGRQELPMTPSGKIRTADLAERARVLAGRS